MRFCPRFSRFSGLSSTKSRFLCAFGVWNPCFQAFRAQNRGFCALFGFATLVFRLFEHKIGVFVRFRGLEPLFSRFPSTKSRFLCASYWGCWPGCGKIGLCERNTERWELKSRIGKRRVTLEVDRMCCGEQNGWFRKRKARNFGVCALLLFVLLPGPPCGRGPPCRREQSCRVRGFTYRLGRDVADCLCQLPVPTACADCPCRLPVLTAVDDCCG